MKALLLYYAELSVFNIPFSMVVGLLSGTFWAGFGFSLASGGMLLAVYFYDEKKYFFYFNKGISKLKLFVSAFILNVGIIVLIFNLQKFFNG